MKRLLALLVLVVVACEWPFPPTVERVSGFYRAETFSTTDSAGTVDWLEERGAVFQIELRAHGGTVGLLYIPGLGPDGTELQSIMTGRWTLSGDTVRLTQGKEPFVRDVAYIAAANLSNGNHRWDRLVADDTVNGVRIQLALRKN